MVNIREKKTGEQTYYYLEHSIREGNRVIKKEKYLGKEIPKDIDKIKRDFVVEIYKEKWFSDFENIKKKYIQEQKIMPPSSRAKQRETFAVKFNSKPERYF